ncbi:MAG TPA: hypothetical protein VFO65_06285, partial [Acidimicrobiales bacterium]|nr:hypothetical protein [Acidimicrobiales bacterium]
MNFPTTPPLRRRAGAALALVLLASTLAPLGAAGDEIADKRAEAERIARQLEEQNRRISMLAEDYDEARLEVAEVEAALTTAQDRVERTDREVGDIRRRLREQAVQSYMRGGA